MSDRTLDEITSDYEVKVHLAIGTGGLPVEVDLEVLADALEVEYDPEENGPGVEYRPMGEDSIPMTTFYTSGSYILRASDEEELYDWQDKTLEKLQSLGVLDEDQAEEVEFEVSNLCIVANIGSHFDLAHLAVGLGFEYAEYEPEQFPAVIYRNPDYECTFSIFNSGKIVLPGSTSTEVGLQELERFVDDELKIWM